MAQSQTHTGERNLSQVVAQSQVRAGEQDQSAVEERSPTRADELEQTKYLSWSRARRKARVNTSKEDFDVQEASSWTSAKDRMDYVVGTEQIL